MEMTITRCLAELKLLDKRINSTIGSGMFVKTNKMSSEKVADIFTKEDFNKNAKSNFDSIEDLIKRRKQIKSKIVKSNAETKVMIGSTEYTVAEAIERKSSLEYDKNLLKELERQYNRELSTLNRQNEVVNAQMEQSVASLYQNSDAKDKNEQIKQYKENYLSTQGYEMVDPLNIVNVIKKLKEDIEDFEFNVDFALSESNSITKIDIE